MVSIGFFQRNFSRLPGIDTWQDLIISTLGDIPDFLLPKIADKLVS